MNASTAVAAASLIASLCCGLVILAPTTTARASIILSLLAAEGLALVALRHWGVS